MSHQSLSLVVAMGLAVFAAGACQSSPTVVSPTPAPNPAQPGEPAPPAPTPSPRITSDSALFAFVTQSQPFAAYAPFPALNAAPDGTLVASSAHQPLIRVSLNATAAGALQNGRLPAGTAFPDGSVIFKEVLTSGRQVNLFAVMYKDRTNTNAGNGWVWAELRPNGGIEYSMANRGSACTGCHSLDRGPQNDFVRIFERQR